MLISLALVLLVKAGVKTCCPTTPLTATGTLADTILYNDVELDLITITGSPFERTWNIKFKPENIYGGDHHTKIYFSNLFLSGLTVKSSTWNSI